MILQFKKLFLFCLIILVAFNTSAQAIKSGLITVSSSEPLYNSGQNIDSFKLWSYNLWFKDSAVIYEVRTHYESTEYLKDSMIIKESYPVSKYVYLNLRTMRAQDYYSLTDTAMPVRNYSFLLKPGDPSYLRPFYQSGGPADTAGMIRLSDTLINGTVNRRIKIPGENIKIHQKYYLLYYFQPGVSRTIYHINPTLDKFFKNYLVAKSEFYAEDGTPISVFKFDISEMKLDRTHRRIFDQWKKNSKETTLPLQTLNEVNKLDMRIVQHENPAIKVVPRKKE